MSSFFRVIAMLVVTLLLTACSAPVDVVTNLQQIEGNEILSVLLNSGLHASKSINKEGMITVTVNADEVAQAIDLLRSRGLPREDFKGLGDVFKKEGMVSSPVEERARYLYALSEELSQTLSSIDGVIIARVHLVLPEHNAFTDTSTPSSAAVFLKYDKHYNIDILQPQIKKLVSHSIPGLSVDNVTIVMIPAHDFLSSDKKLEGAGAAGQEVGGFAPLIMVVILLFVVAFGAIGFAVYLSRRKKNDQH